MIDSAGWLACVTGACRGAGYVGYLLMLLYFYLYRLFDSRFAIAEIRMGFVARDHQRQRSSQVTVAGTLLLLWLHICDQMRVSSRIIVTNKHIALKA